MIMGKEVLILMDCGALTNFIFTELVQQLNFKVNDTKVYELEVGMGANVRNRGICKLLEVVLCNIFFIMELRGTNLVLRMD